MRAITAEEIRKIAGGRGRNTNGGLKPMVVKGPPGSESNPIPLPSTPVTSTPSYPFDSGPYSNPYPSGPGGVPVSPPGGGGAPPGGGGGGPTGTSVDWGSHLKGDADLQTLVQATGLSAELQAAGILNVKVGTAPGGIPGDSGYDASTHTIYVSTTDWTSFQKDGNEGAVALAGDIAHELGHAEHPAPSEYTFKGLDTDFIHQHLLSEGWATENELLQEQADEAHGYTEVTYAVGENPQQAAVDQQTFDSDVSQGKTAAQIAADLGDDVSGVELPNGENYTELFDSEYQQGQAWQQSHPGG